MLPLFCKVGEVRELGYPACLPSLTKQNKSKQIKIKIKHGLRAALSWPLPWRCRKGNRDPASTRRRRRNFPACFVVRSSQRRRRRRLQFELKRRISGKAPQHTTTPQQQCLPGIRIVVRAQQLLNPSCLPPYTYSIQV